MDIPHIKTVLNYDVARDIDTHTHRIGRTGRAGEKGTAYTLVTEKDKEFAGHLVRNLEGANQEVPKSLMDLAMQSAWFRKSRFKGGKGKSLNIGGAGLGFRGRPNTSNSVYIIMIIYLYCAVLIGYPSRTIGTITVYFRADQRRRHPKISAR